MSREDLLKIDGVVVEALSGGQFSVKLGDERMITAKISGRLRKFHISIIAGDRVTIGISPYDLTHGLILSRERLTGGGPKIRR